MTIVGTVEHRMRLPHGTPLAPLPDLCAGVTAGLAEHLDEVQAIDALVEPGAGTVRMLHAAVDADRVPLTVESAVSTMDGGLDVHCRLFRTAGAEPPLAVEVDVSGAVTARVRRYGPQARADLPGLTGPVSVPAVALPGWLFALAGLGPRPAPRFPGTVVTTVDDLLVRGEVPADLPEDARAALTALAARRPRRLRLDWAAGVVTEPGEDVELTATGRIDVVDGAEAGLWLVTPLPPELREDGVPADAQALHAIAPADLWHQLVALLA